MLRALWLIFRLGLLVIAVVKVADVPGKVSIDWQDYTFNINLGFFLLTCIVFVLLTLFIYQTIRTFVDFPRSFRRYREVRRQEKGYRALTLGLTAVAAGDGRAALSQARKARKLMPQDTGLPLLLEAQAARMEGRDADAHASFSLLLENKDAAFLGVRGLLQSALDRGDLDGALALSHRALSFHPRQPWILKLVYDLQIRARQWEKALDTLARAEKVSALPREMIRSDRTALLLALSDDLSSQGFVNDARDHALRAVKIAPDFSPAVIRLAHFYMQGGYRRRARGLIEKCWKAAPHPELMSVWGALIDEKAAGDSMARLRWAERLMKVNGASAAGWIETARAAMAAGLWGEAKTFLKRAEAIEESAALYRLYSELEDRMGGNRESVREWLLRASARAMPSKCWVCKVSGRVYPQWAPVAEPHGSFNTIVWDYPAAAAQPAPLIAAPGGDIAQTLTDAPRAVTLVS